MYSATGVTVVVVVAVEMAVVVVVVVVCEIPFTTTNCVLYKVIVLYGAIEIEVVEGEVTVAVVVEVTGTTTVRVEIWKRQQLQAVVAKSRSMVENCFGQPGYVWPSVTPHLTLTGLTVCGS